MDKRITRNPRIPHVTALVFTCQGTMCFVLPAASIRKGDCNLTVPAGPVHQIGSRYFETPEDSIRFRLKQEVGIGREQIIALAPVGEVLCRTTAQGEIKSTQPYVVVVDQEICKPTVPAKVEQVVWCPSSGWPDLIEQMHEGKQELVHQVMAEASALEILPANVKRDIEAFVRGSAVRCSTA